MAAPPVVDISSSPAGTQSKVPPSSHRLATVSASDALLDLESPTSSHVRTGLPALDAALGGPSASRAGGLERNKITELWGPSGAGTTAIALHTTVNALEDGKEVIWVDCAAPLSETRLKALLSHSQQASTEDADIHDFENVKHLSAPTLSHLLALVLHPSPALFTQKTALIVIDGLTILMDFDYPRAQAMGSNRTEVQKWQAGRRYAVLGSLVTALNKLAALNNIAVIVTTGCAMRSRPDSELGGALAPGIGGVEWDAGVWNRLAVFRDFVGSFVGIQKHGGKSLISREEIGEPGQLIGFDVDLQNGMLQERRSTKTANGTSPPAKLKLSPVKSRKRYIDEVADSEGEDEYGWDAGVEDYLNHPLPAADSA